MENELNKPVVHYEPVDWPCDIVVGWRADVIPIDHPRTHLNGAWATTSTIVSVEEGTGNFETKNTKYIRV